VKTVFISRAHSSQSCALWRRNGASEAQRHFATTLGISEVFLKRSERKIWEKKFCKP
jgi:hypothetical protein